MLPVFFNGLLVQCYPACCLSMQQILGFAALFNFAEVCNSCEVPHTSGSTCSSCPASVSLFSSSLPWKQKHQKFSKLFAEGRPSPMYAASYAGVRGSNTSTRARLVGNRTSITDATKKYLDLRLLALTVPFRWCHDSITCSRHLWFKPPPLAREGLL